MGTAKHQVVSTSTTTPKLSSEDTTTQMSLRAKIVDSVLVIGGVAAAGAVAGGVAAAINNKNEKKTKASASVLSTNSHFEAANPDVSSRLSEAHVNRPQVPQAPAQNAPAGSIEMFQKASDVGTPSIGQTHWKSRLPSIAWMLVILLAFLGACLLAAGVVHLICCGRKKKSTRSWSPKVDSEAQDEADEEIRGAATRAEELELPTLTPLLHPLPPLLPTVNLSAGAPIATAYSMAPTSISGQRIMYQVR